jgi:hypothetical protein
MERQGDELQPRPLPAEWLPAAAPAEGSEAWEALRLRVMATAAQARQGVRTRAEGWPSVLGSWWRPAAALATAAVALLLLLGPAPAGRPGSDGAVTLSVVAGGGEPAALLDGLGIPAHPVLALIALQAETP